MNLAAWNSLFQWVSIISIVLALISSVGLLITSSKIEASKDAKLAKLENISDYTHIANLDGFGKPIMDGDIVFSTPVSMMLDGTYEKQGSLVHFREDKEAEEKYLAIIHRFPDFPFTYYYLATSMRSRGDAAWREYAEKGRAILQKTTLVKGRKPHHDEVLQKINEMLNEKK